MNKKYFFFDIDGTLTDKSSGQIVPSAKKAIDLLQKKGHFVAIATGRAYYKTRDIAKELGIHHVVSNGGAAITIHDKLLENAPLDRDLAVALCKEATDLGFGVLVSFDDSIDVMMLDDSFLNQAGYRLEPTRYNYYPHLSFDDIKEFYKIYIAVDAQNEYKLSLLDSLGHIRFLGDYLIYQHDKKDEGILKMLDYLHADMKDVVVFGDDVNDLVMFKDGWMNIAMGNACDELKHCADFVTKNNVNDGIMYACQYFDWI